MTIDNRSGAVKVILSGRNYRKDELDLATTGHQPGSAFKPFVLAGAFKEGIPPTQTYSSSSPWCSPLWDDEDHCVENAEGSGVGHVDLYTATEDSINVVFAQLILDVGASVVADIAERMIGMDPATEGLPAGAGARDRLGGDLARSTWPPATRRSRTTGKHCEPYTVQIDRARRQGAAGARARVRPRPQAGRRSPDHVDARGRAGLGHGGERVRRMGELAGRREDRHGAGEHERLVRRLHEAVHDRRLGRLAREPLSDGPRLRRHGRGADLGVVHVEGDAGTPGDRVPRPAEAARGPRAERHRHEAGRKRSTTLSEAGFRVSVEIADSLSPKGQVFSQSPGGGTVTALGTLVQIQISTGVPAQVTMPRVVDMRGYDGERRSSSHSGWSSNIVRVETGDPAKVGYVIAQDPRSQDRGGPGLHRDDLRRRGAQGQRDGTGTAVGTAAAEAAVAEAS